MSQQTLTPEIIERAALIFCRMTGKDPNAKFSKGSKLTNGEAARIPITDHAICAQALREALGGNGPARPTEMEKPTIIPVNFN